MTTSLVKPPRNDPLDLHVKCSSGCGVVENQTLSCGQRVLYVDMFFFSAAKCSQ